VNPGLQVMKVSATTGEGLGAWTAWIEAGLARQGEGKAFMADLGHIGAP